MNRETKLTPAQRKAAKCLLRGLHAEDVLVLEGRPGMGKTTVLQEVNRQAGGILLGVRQFLEVLNAHSPAAIEEAFLGMLDQAVATHDLILIDDFHLVTDIAGSCDYQRSHLLDAALTAVLGEASDQGKKIVFATAKDAPWPVRRRAMACQIGAFTVEDDRCLCVGGG